MSVCHAHSLARRLFSTAPSPETVVIALGSNLGNRPANLHSAIASLRAIGDIQATSFLYESQPMYITDQPPFLNAALTLTTTQSPTHLLQSLKQIETALGRNPNTPPNGPRPIDLDIITYGTQRISTSVLEIPHPRVAEREFVLRPLCDLSPSLSIGNETAQSLSNTLGQASGLIKVTPTASGRLLRWGERTLLMGILNVTPDSFSDGGLFTQVDTALKQAEKFCDYNFDVIDIGGQSTRPGARRISTEEELERVLPIAKAIRDNFPQMLISADTFDSKVAQAMIDQGADIINDVSGGRFDQHMYNTISSTGAAGVLMHMRGDSQTMGTMTQYNGDLTSIVASELSTCLQAAQSSGIPRWSLIADCGVGFAKKAEQSVELIRNGEAFKQQVGKFPTLLGASRKSWMKVLGVKDKDWATAGVVCSTKGWDMIRVHEAKVADAIRAADYLRG